jgi:glycine cleavage system T protein (aminomethyltransferase)
MDTKTQVEAARGSVLAIAGHFAVLAIAGADRLTWLNGLVTCDLGGKRVGDATYGLVVARNGRVLADVVIFLDESRLLLALPLGVMETLRRHLEHYLIMEDVEITDGADAFEAWAFHGPRSQDLLSEAQREGGVGSVLDRTGLGGAIIFAARAHSDGVGRRIAESTRDLGGAVGDAAGWRALRLERGVAEFGEDFDDTTYPQEAGLEKVAVSFDKGCYLGQEVVCMLELRGHVNRRLMPLVLEAGGLPLPGAGVTDLAGVSVGKVTSAALSPTLGKAVALAMVKRAHANPANVVLIDGARAEVVDRPA